MRDLLNNIQVVHLGNLTLSGVTPAASGWVDRRGYEECTLIAIANTITDAGTAAGFTLTMQEGDSSAASEASAVAAADAVEAGITLTETADDADDSIIGALGYLGNSRYVRLNAVGTTGTNADVSVIAILSRPSIAATTLEGTAVAAT